MQAVNFLLLVDRQFLKHQTDRARHQRKAEHRGDEVRFFLVERLPAQRAVRHQIHFHRAGRQIAQTKAHDLTQTVRDARKLFQIHRRINLHVAERIEILDRHIQFFRKKLRRVRHDGRAAGQK